MSTGPAIERNNYICNTVMRYESSVLCLSGLGIGFSHFTERYKQVKQRTLGILKQFGFGKKAMESRIMTEVESLVQHIRGLHGKSFNPSTVVQTYVANVTLSILYGRRFGHIDPVFLQLLTDMKTFAAGMSFETEMFPVLRFLPYYRNKIRETVAALRRILQFVENNVKACQQVRIFKNQLSLRLRPIGLHIATMFILPAWPIYGKCNFVTVTKSR